MRFVTFSLWGILFGLFVLVAPHASLAQSGQKTQLSQEAVQADMEMVRKIRGIFQEIQSFKDVFVTVNSGVVTMKGRVLELEDITKAEVLASKIGGVISINNQIQVETSVERRLAPAFDRLMERLQQAATFLPIVAIGFLVFLIVSAIGFAVASIRKPFDSISPNRFIANLLRQMVRIIFIVLGVVIALDIVGATALLGTILGAAGILGLAIGFAVRDTVENYIASVLLSFRQPFKPRDCVKVGEQEGYVIALTSRATVLLTYDGNHVMIPNATVYKGVLTNFTRNPERRFSFTLDVVTDDLTKAVKLGVEAIRALEFILKEPVADGWIESINDSRLTLWFGGWINQNEHSIVKSKSEAIRKVRMALAAEGIDIAEPIYRLSGDRPSSATRQKPAVRKTGPKTAAQTEDFDAADVSTDSYFEEILVEQEKLHIEEDLLDVTDTGDQGKRKTT